MKFKQFGVRLAAILVIGAGVLTASRVSAQGVGGGMPPGMAEKIKAWQKWGANHKKLTNLSTMLYQIREINKAPATHLTKPQAVKMLGILNAWHARQTMTETQAGDVAREVGALLNDRQIKKMATIAPPFGRGGGRAPGGSGARPGGAGGRPFTMPDPPAQGFNPFNPDTLPFAQMRPQAKKSMDDFTVALNRQAH